MNGDISVARRYAAALFGMAKKRGEVDAVAANLREVADAARGSRDLMGVMHHPLLTLEKKKSVLRAVFSGRVRPDVEKFLFLVVEKNRAVMLPQIVNEFDRLL
ncbi:ATP synthase F1 subunit delta, partial [bacterium]